MADITALKNRIRAAIKQNGNQEITGVILQTILLDIADSFNSADESNSEVLSSAISNETSRAQGAESNLSISINNETSRAQGAENTLDEKINNETSRAQGAESSLSTSINNETSRAQGAENTLDEKINNETSRAQGAESSLSTSINNETSRAQGAESSLEARIISEGSSRAAGEAILANAINAESARAISKEATSVIFDSTTKFMAFKNANGEVLYQFDASPFIVDGMVDDVYIENGNLIISFNTESGKQDITIPLADIFNPSNYYDKESVDALLQPITTLLSAGYLYMGIAAPSSTPNISIGNIFYIALTPGIYTNFNLIDVFSGITILKYNGSSWSKDCVLNTENIIFDISLANASGGALATYSSLSTALNAIDVHDRKSGMTIKFLNTNGTYEQYRYTLSYTNNSQGNIDFCAVKNWEKVAADTGMYTCLSPAVTVVKAVNAPGYIPRPGGSIKVKFTNDNTGVNPASYPIVICFNDSAVAPATQYPIIYNGAPATEENSWAANEVVEFYFDGTNYVGVKAASSVTVSQNTDIKGQQLEIDSQKVDNLADVFNVNAFNDVSTPYSSKTEARNSVPRRLRKVGSIITYLLNSGWITEQFVSGSWLSGGWQTLIDEPTHTQTFGTMPTSELSTSSAGFFMTIANNIVNKYQPLVSLSFRFGAYPSSFNAQIAIIDEDTMEIVARKVISRPSQDVAITLTPEDLPFDINHSERNLGIWLGAARTDETAIGYVSGAGSVKFLDMTTMEITTSTLYNIALTITKKIYSTNDYQNKQIDDLNNLEIQEITNGNKLTATGSPYSLQEGLLWAIPDNIINKFNQFVKATILVINTGKVVVALVDEDNVTEIERKEFEVTQGIPLEISVADFDFDVNSSTKNIGLYATSYTRNAREMGYTMASNFQCKYISNGSIVIENDIILGIEITKKLMNVNLMTKELTENLQSEINEISAEIGTGVVIDDLQDYITNHRNVFLGVGTYTIEEPLVIPNNTKLVGVRGATIIQLGSANLIADLTAKQNITFENITFLGKTAHDTDVSLGSDDAARIAAIKNRAGAGTDKGFYIAGAAQSITFTRCEFANFGFSGLHFKQTHTGTNPYFKKFKITDCEFHNSWYGLMVDVRCEFSTFMGCTFAYNEIGMFVDGGNNYFGICHFDKNYINVVVSGISNNNDSHGSIVGSSFNHASVYGLACIDVHNGYLFNGCMLFEKGIIMSNAKNICWNNGWISGKVIVDSEPSNQISMIRNTIFGVDYQIGIEGNPVNLSLSGNRFQDGRSDTDINNNI